MEKKKLIQIILFIFLLLITFVIYNTYYKKNEEIIKSTKEIEVNKQDINQADEEKNIIKDIKYTSNNTNGDVFEILADYGEPSKEIPNLMFLTNVKANIFLKNKSNIKLTSDFANFNTKTFETTFMNNVKILRDDETIQGNELYLVFDQPEEKLKNNPNLDQNLIRISDKVIIKKPGYILKADILEIDLVTKDIKVYMNDKNNKVQAKSKLN
tara:strand:- start:383 stop:1018 length:636 start_codon:yes stop_codon:yes gene_type:complete